MSIMYANTLHNGFSRKEEKFTKHIFALISMSNCNASYVFVCIYIQPPDDAAEGISLTIALPHTHPRRSSERHTDDKLEEMNSCTHV